MSTIVWMDVETTGLNVGQDMLLEIGLVATTGDLEPIEGIPDFSACLVPSRALDLMSLDPKVVAMHSRSGLFEDLREVSQGRADVDNGVRIWISNLLNVNGPSDPPYVVAGSTVSFDRAWFSYYWPKIDKDLLHYRSIDVSTVKELVRRWYGEDALPKLLEEPAEHRSIPDIHRSIEELRYYRKHFFVGL